ncbi:protein FAM78B isoform X1 [Octopus bimaculoides]|nr:protein FAM78B isoform X1 [Octopus bimaculoides]|eukprot:XP_014790473.1 PREDICTED: protein FAM78B-like isoform X1 [Octopus bimaculoides]
MPTAGNVEAKLNDSHDNTTSCSILLVLKNAFHSCVPFSKLKLLVEKNGSKNTSPQEIATVYANFELFKSGLNTTINDGGDSCNGGTCGYNNGYDDYYSEAVPHPHVPIGKVKESRIGLLNVEAGIENVPTKIDESSSSVIKYRTPNFRASATVQMAPSMRSESWKIGWIQACTKMIFRNTYSNEGFTSWEFQELTSNKQPMISDCDGCYYPWYGARDETVVFHCPSLKTQETTLVMNDNFHPHVTWRNPANENQIEPNLTNIIRNQSFYVWLLAWNMTTGKSYILMNIYWTMNLEIVVDPHKKLGERAMLVSPQFPEQPIILKEKIPIPRCALSPPNANSAQRLVWNPKRGRPVVIIPPVWNSKKSAESQIQKHDSKL